MPWIDLANNQAVTFNNLWDSVNAGVFIQKATIPVSNKCILKADANEYVYIDTAFYPFANKPANKLIIKSDLQNAAGVFYMTTFGSYPVSGTGLRVADIKVRNTSGGTIYVYALYNSGGASSGFANGYIQLIEQSTVYVFGNITAIGQNTYSSTYFTIPNNTTVTISVVKDDSIGSGSSMRAAYSTTIGGTKITL